MNRSQTRDARPIIACGTAALLIALVAGCASPPPPPPPPPVSSRVILLPQADGRPSAVEVIAGGRSVRLDQPYAEAALRGDQLQTGQTSAEAVRATYGSLLTALPARPRQFILQFEPNGSRLAAGSDSVIAQMQASLAQLPAAEVIITGHTDRVGSLEANDRLSLQRAEAVRELLVAAGVDRARVGVVGRGEREPAVPTADEVAEPRNRRVEIKIR